MDTKSNKWWTEIDNSFEDLLDEKTDEKFTPQELWKIYSIVKAQKITFMNGKNPYINLVFPEYGSLTIRYLLKNDIIKTRQVDKITPDVFTMFAELPNVIDIDLYTIGITILKYPEDWYWVNYFYFDKTDLYYRCDGFLGLQKLLEYLDLDR